MWQETRRRDRRNRPWLRETNGAAVPCGRGSGVWNASNVTGTGPTIVDREDFDRAAAQWVAAAINCAVDERGSCSIALAGGSTPRPVYWKLSQPPFRDMVSWNRLFVYFGDERAVPPDHPDNNYGAAREALLRHVAIPEDHVFRMQAERADREVAAAEYQRRLPERLDILLLGMGPDGHTASLFPGSPAVDERTRKVVPVIAPKSPAARLTITQPVISAARQVLMLVAGADKAATVVRALRSPYAPRDLPAQLARDGTWILDRAAAAGLA
jgi:6-phosphogluconolactonase